LSTFGSWLSAQSNRQDQIGHFAAYWREHGVPRMHSPASIDRHLDRNGDYGRQEGLQHAYTAALVEYRGSRGLTLAPEPAALAEQRQRFEDETRMRLSAIEGMIMSIGARLGIDWGESQDLAVTAPLSQNSAIAQGLSTPEQAAQRPAQDVTPQEALRATADAAQAAAAGFSAAVAGPQFDQVDWSTMFSMAQRSDAAEGA
jgi:hypothetical protein